MERTSRYARGEQPKRSSTLSKTAASVSSHWMTCIDNSITQPAQFIAVCSRSEMGAWARESLGEAYVFAGDEPCTGEEIHRAAA